MQIAGILLAAGESYVQSSPLALLPYQGLSFVDNILNNLSEIHCSPVITILGESAELICNETRVNTFQCFNNPDPEGGPLSSIKLALEHLPDGIEGVILAMVEHPLVKLETYQAIHKAAQTGPRQIIIPEFYGRKGHPIYFGKNFFDLLRNASDDIDSEEIIERFIGEIRTIPVQDEGIIMNIDREDSLSELLH